MKKLIGAVLVGSMLLGACSEEAVKEETKAVEQKDEPAKAEKPDPAPEPKEEKVEPEIETDDLISPELMLEILQRSYATTAEVSYDEGNKVFQIMPTNPDFVTAIALMESGKMPKTEWNVLMDSMLEMSGTLSTGYAVYLMNPANADRVLAVFMNGVLIYDGINDTRPFEGL